MILMSGVFTVPRLLLAFMAPPILGFAFLAALAPALISGVSAFFKHKGAGSAAKRQEAADLAKQRAEYEKYQASPEAILQRVRSTARLGRILGALGGRAKAPPSLVALYDRMRAQQPFTHVPGYVQKPSGWDLAGGLLDAAGNFNPAALGEGGVSMPRGGVPGLSSADILQRLRGGG